MFEKFENIDKEKKERILSVALKEFSDNGYVKANTNIVCKNSEISKGLLFHYFTSKKNLFSYILNDVMREMMQRLNEYMPKEQMDLFDLITETSMAKLRIGLEMPEGYRIIYEVLVNTPKDLEDIVDEKLKAAWGNQRENFQQLVDESKFKEGIDKKRAIDLIFACSKCLYDQYIDLYKTLSPEQALEQIDDVRIDMLKSFEMLKTAFYKPEYCQDNNM